MPLRQGAVRGRGGAAADRALPVHFLPAADRRSRATFAGFKRCIEITWSRGAPAVYRSPTVRRSFCRARGSPMSDESDGYRNEIYLVIGAFDEPGQLPPTAHVHVAQKISWFEFADGLPRFAASAAGSRHWPPAPPRPGISEPTHGPDARLAVGRLRKPRAGEAGPVRHDRPRDAQTQSASAAAVLGFRTMRPRYMPLFRSTWCGRRSSPESLSST